MKVKEFLDVVTFNIIDYAKIYEMYWNEVYNDYDCKFADKRVKNKKDLEPYYDCELHYFDYETCWGEYDDSAIYIKMPKPSYQNGQEIECPYCGEKIKIKFGSAACGRCGWFCKRNELADSLKD